MEVALTIVAFALAAGGLFTYSQARGQRWRWGWRERIEPSAGEGVYRSAPVTLRSSRAMPIVCVAAAVTSAAWGILTLFVFAPAGILGCAVVAPAAGDGVLSVLGLLGLTAAVFHGFYLGARLAGLVVPLARRSAGAAEQIGRVARRSLGHHALVVAAFGAGFPRGADQMVLVAAVLCGIGALQAGLLFAARAALARLDREDAARSHEPDRAVG